MILISHRGNIDSINPEKENTHFYIDDAILKGYDVEIDIWKIENKLFLGHDIPEHETSISWLKERKEKLWVHCKNFDALSYLVKEDIRVFYHSKEEYTILNNRVIWAHNLEKVDKNCIIPLLTLEQVEKWKPQQVYGVCSDFVYQFKQIHSSIL